MSWDIRCSTFFTLNLGGGGDTLLRACTPIHFHPVYFVCVQIMGSFLASFILLHIAPALDTGLMLHLLLRSQVGTHII
jgi:hypothetical protein